MLRVIIVTDGNRPIVKFVKETENMPQCNAMVKADPYRKFRPESYQCSSSGKFVVNGPDGLKLHFCGQHHNCWNNSHHG